MQLTLTQRIHVASLLREQEGNVGDVLAIGKMLDKIQLTEADEKEVNFRVTGNLFLWDPAKGDTETTVPLTDGEKSRLKRILDGWPKFRPVDAQWLGPLMESLQ